MAEEAGVTLTEHCHIIRKKGILSEEPIVKGTRTPVRAIVRLWQSGYAPEEIPSGLPHLSLAAVFDAQLLLRPPGRDKRIHRKKQGATRTHPPQHTTTVNGELFITVYLDEDVHILVARLLAQRNCVAVTARDADQLGKSDPEQLEYAAKRGMVIVTHNRGDFEALHREYLASGRIHAGILIAIDNRP